MEVKPGYKQTPVGPLPDTWECLPIGADVQLLSGHHVLASQCNTAGQGVPYITGPADFPEGVIRHTKYTTKPTTICQQGDILITVKGSGTGALATADREYCISRQLMAIRPRCWDTGYIYATLARGIESFSQAATGLIPGLSRGEILGRYLAIPPLPEQRAIAQSLSDSDDLIQSLERLILKKRGLKQAAMQQLLTGQTRLPGFSGEWQQTQVREVISEYFSGPSPTCEERNISAHAEWGVLKTTAATKKDGWNWRAHKTLPKAFWNKPNLELRKGDVIVTKAGPRHRVGVTAWVDYVPERIIPSGKMIALRPHPERVVPLMLAAAIDSKKSQKFLDDRTTGMAESQVNFENDALLQAPIAIPSMKEQRAIAEVLSDMDAEITALEARLMKTRDLKQGMMQELLTGRTRLV